MRPAVPGGELQDRRVPDLRRPPGGSAPLDGRLYLPEDCTLDAGRRNKLHVPEGVFFQEKRWIAAYLLGRCREGLPHGFVVGDDEFAVG